MDFIFYELFCFVCNALALHYFPSFRALLHYSENVVNPHPSMHCYRPHNVYSFTFYLVSRTTFYTDHTLDVYLGMRAPARGHTEIFSADGSTKIGEITSGGFGPTCNKPVAMGYETTFVVRTHLP